MTQSLTIKSSKQGDLSDESLVVIRHFRVHKTLSIDNVINGFLHTSRENFSDGVRAVIYPVAVHDFFTRRVEVSSSTFWAWSA